ncbi:MAG: hypothetical protein RLZZ450_7062 [Pseudomonadota bacterium]|jgi:uncharacterized repeat protein (TIGR04052 family)
MRRTWIGLVLLLSSMGCESDSGATLQQTAVDAALEPVGHVTVIDAGASLDASLAAPNVVPAVPDAGRVFAEPAAADEPPATRDGMRLYAVRFDLRAGEQPFGCGKTAKLGVSATESQLVDARLFVHDVSLTRSSGEKVPLILHQDGRFQRDNVALLDFVDDSGLCKTGSPEQRKVVYGYAPEQADYTGISFRVGMPADKNHLDGAIGPPPYNVTGMWWSWSGGYKYVKFELSNAAQPIWYFHGGAAGCSGMSESGFACKARQLALIELSGWDANSSLVVLDAEKLYAGSDPSKAADSLPGCMGGQTDTECLPLYGALGVVAWDDAAKGPEQTAFDVRPGTPWQPSQVVGPTKPRLITDPSVWPDPSYVRNADLDRSNISSAAGDDSHKQGDPRYGANCMRCHQASGPGVGRFSAAGTVVDLNGLPAKGTKVEIFSGTADRPNKTFLDVTRYALLEVDQNGNFFTTEPIPYAQQKLTARILGPDGRVLESMFSTKQTGACNTCHTASFRLEIPLGP